MTKNIELPQPLPVPKKELKHLAAQFISDPSMTVERKFAFLKRMKDLVAIIERELLPEVIAGMEEDSLEVDGITFTSQVRNTYDFSHDEVIADLEAQIKDRKGWMKKAASQPVELVVDGEVIPPAKVKTGKPFLKAEY